MTGLDTSRFEIQSISFDGDVATVVFRGLLKPGQSGALVTQHDRLRCGRIAEEWAEFKVERQ